MVFQAADVTLLGGSCGMGKQVVLLQLVAMVHQVVATVPHVAVRSRLGVDRFLYYTG